jgi:predicted permease
MEEQLEKELRFHIEQHTNELIAEGHAPDEARRQARLALGGPEQVKEYCRDARGTRGLEDVLQDFRYAVRTLRNQTGFAAITVVILALGIGATTAIFSAVNLVFFETLPYPHASRLVVISDFAGGDDSRGYVAFHTYREVAERSRSFDAIAVVKPWQPTLAGPSEPERFDGQIVTASFFRVMGVPPFLGRDFEESDDRFEGPNTVILSEALWKRRFGGNATIIGRQVTLDDNSYTVIGVMPSAFENVLAPSAQLWTTLQYDTSNASNFLTREWGNHLRMIGRLQPGVSAGQAKRELDVIGRTSLPEFPRPPWASHKQGFLVNSLQDDVTRAVKPALVAVLGAVLLVLVIACVNVTNLLLAHGVRRRGEFALRTTLGAGRSRRRCGATRRTCAGVAQPTGAAAR